MTPVFNALEQHLKAQVTALKLVEQWNSQLLHDNAEKLLPFPCAFYQLDGIRTQTISPGIQHCEGILRVRHCDWQLKTGKLRAYPMEAATYLALQGYQGGPLLVGLDRQALYPDPDHDAVQVIISEYRIKYTDTSKFDQRWGRLTKGVTTVVE